MSKRSFSATSMKVLRFFASLVLIAVLLVVVEMISPGIITGPVERLSSGIYNLVDAIFAFIYSVLVLGLLVTGLYLIIKWISN